MLAGHVAVAFAGKRIEPRISLGTWMVGALLADLLAFVFLISGLEQFTAVPGVTSNRFVGHIPYSHSLAMDALWAMLFAAGVYIGKRPRRAAWLLFGGVLSHWILDVISHRPDMPLAPGTSMVLGFGLWNSLPATLLCEGGAWLLAIFLYAGVTKANTRPAAVGFWAGTALITLIWVANIRSGIDPNPVRAGISGLVVFSAMIAWAYRMNRARTYFNTSSI